MPQPKIIFMCSPLSELQIRKNNDPFRQHSNFDLKAFEIENKWFSKRPVVEILNIAGLTSEMMGIKSWNGWKGISFQGFNLCDKTEQPLNFSTSNLDSAQLEFKRIPGKSTPSGVIFVQKRIAASRELSMIDKAGSFAP